MCTLCNLSVDEELSARMSSSEILPLLVKYLEDEDIKVEEAAGGVLANLSLRQSNHKIMVEAGVIPKLVRDNEIYQCSDSCFCIHLFSLKN